MTAGADGGRPGELAGVETAPTISAHLIRTAEFACTLIQWDSRAELARIEIGQGDAFLIMLLREYLPGNPYWVDGKPVNLEPRRRGQFNMFDLHHAHDAEVQAAVDCISLQFPKAALNTLAEERGMSRLLRLKSEPGKALEDPVVWHLSESLMPALARPSEANDLFVEQVGLSLSWHLIDRYGEPARHGSYRVGGLAPWQERQAKALLMASIAGGVSLVELANTCHLSRSHFARSFKETTGLAPHRWLLRERIRQAKRLLEFCTCSIKQVAKKCGFADQSHFTRTFTRAVRATPGQWRRDRSGKPQLDV